MCLLSADIHDYHFVSQGMTTINNVDDAEELRMTDVSLYHPSSDHHHHHHDLVSPDLYTTTHSDIRSAPHSVEGYIPYAWSALFVHIMNEWPKIFDLTSPLQG